MDYKQKYEEALSKAQQLLEDDPEVPWTNNDILYIFPELKLSKEERIISLIKQVLNESTTEKDECYSDNGVTQQEVFAWLEKQGEQKPAWSKEDEAIYYGVIETEQYMLDVVNGIKKFNVGNISIKEECTRELNWLKSLKDKCLPQPKQEWSEEDDKNLKGAIQQMDLLEEYINDDSFVTEVAKQFSLEVCRSVKNWLKSLRPQNRWKPSDEQIRVVARLRHCLLEDVRGNDIVILDNLLEQLKALKL